MKVSKTILESIIRRTLLEMPLPTGLPDPQEESESAFRAAYEITTTLFGEKRFDLVLTKAGGKVLQSIMVKSMSGKTSVYVPKMLENMKIVMNSRSFQSKMADAADRQIDKIVLENPDLDIGKNIAKTSVGYLVRAIFSTDVAEEAFFALIYRFFPPTNSDFAIDAMELQANYGPWVEDLLRATPDGGTVTFGTADLEFIGSPKGMEGLARKVYDQVTKFYYHHDEYDEPGYKDYGLHFGPGGPDGGAGGGENYWTNWQGIDLKL